MACEICGARFCNATSEQLGCACRFAKSKVLRVQILDGLFMKSILHLSCVPTPCVECIIISRDHSVTCVFGLDQEQKESDLRWITLLSCRGRCLPDGASLSHRLFGCTPLNAWVRTARLQEEESKSPCFSKKLVASCS